MSVFSKRYPMTAKALRETGVQLTEKEAEKLFDFFLIKKDEADEWLAEWVMEDTGMMLKALKMIDPPAGEKSVRDPDFEILRQHPGFQSKEVPIGKTDLPLSGLEARRQRGVVDRVVTTITLDPIVIRLLRLVSKITGRRISYMLEDAFVESKSFYEGIEIIITKISPPSKRV